MNILLLYSLALFLIILELYFQSFEKRKFSLDFNSFYMSINYNDSNLWDSFINGNEGAFSMFYKKNYTKLYSYGMSLGLDDDQARDIIQELFIKLYANPLLIKDTSTIQSFLFVSVRNAFINHIKFKKKHINYQQIDNFEFPYVVENNRLEDEEEIKIIKAKVDKIISTLTPRQKEIIYLRFLQQMEYDEIAQVMNMTEQAARNLIHRAVEKARKDNPELAIILFVLILLSE